MASRLRRLLSSVIVLGTVAGLVVGLAAWKANARGRAGAPAGASEPAEVVTVVHVRADETHPATTAIGTVLALRSVTLRNELAGTVREVNLVPGQIVEAGAVLVAMDVEVERAELAALEARAALAETTLARLERLVREQATSEATVDQARAERDVALAEIARTRAIIARKTVRAPFRARVGLADVHTGQYLDAGTVLTTLQDVGGAVHVDFAVPQEVAASLSRRGTVLVTTGTESARAARIVAVDARVNPETRNATVRARLEGGSGDLPAPGASVQVQVPTGRPERTHVIPASALRKGPEGDHVFVVAEASDGQLRATSRRVEAGALTGDDVFIRSGLTAGERVASSGSFKLRDGMLVSVADGPRASARR